VAYPVSDPSQINRSPSLRPGTQPRAEREAGDHVARSEGETEGLRLRNLADGAWNPDQSG
jgi:hypothetical protein